MEWILQNTESSVDFGTIHSEYGIGWENMIRIKTADSGFMNLVRSIQERGWLSAIGWDDGCITEGHHRLCAAILLCEDVVPCTRQGTDYGMRTSRYVSGHDEYDEDGEELGL